MAALAFVLSQDGSDPPLTDLQKEEAKRTLQERAPGPVQEHTGPGVWAAASGPFGGLLVSGKRLLLRDGSGWGEQEAPFEPPYGSGWYSACLYDGESGEVQLVTDHFGIRPLFHARHAGRLLVASECKTLQALGLPLEVNRAGLREALMYRWVSGEACLLSPPTRVPAGTETRIRRDGAVRSRRYWAFQFDREPMSPGAMESYQEQVETALRTFLRKLDRKGAPVGILLSGGVDSSLMAAIAKEELGGCIGFAGRIPGFENPELERAQLVAGHLGIELRVVDIDPTQFPRDVPYMVRRLEELPRHPNNLVLLQLLRAAAAEVKVLLQGDGADTLYGVGSIARMRHYTRKRDLVRWLPRPLARALVRIAEALPQEKAWAAAAILAWDETRYALSRDAIEYRRAVRKVLGLSRLDDAAWESEGWSQESDIDRLRPATLVASGIQGSLIRHDRLSRPEGIESLAPFVAGESVGVAVRMPRELLYQGERTKPVLRGLCDRYLPGEITRLKKAGFEVPWGEWLFGAMLPLAQEAERALASNAYLPTGFMEAALRSGDREGVWSGLSFYYLLKEFGLLENQR